MNFLEHPYAEERTGALSSSAEVHGCCSWVCVCLQSVLQGLYFINYLLMKFHVQRSVCEVQLASGMEAGSRILFKNLETTIVTRILLT